MHCSDLSMILCDPFACNTLVLSIMRNLQELLSQDALPRVSILCTRRHDAVMVFYCLTASGGDTAKILQAA